jgi:outer membrane cobalamin receptor
VTRHTLLAAAALHSEFAFRRTKLEADAHLLFNDVVDRVADLDTLPTYRRLSPFLSVMYSLGGGTTLRMFYKMTYRAPNFGELYFFQLFPRNLRPEQAHQVNLGITHVQQWETASLQATCDLYTNHVKDKIIAKPTTNMYYWSMENLGIVDILGLDATAEFHFSLFTFHLNYSYQHAVDHSKEGSKTYGHQIVYTPRHSGGASVRWENRWVNLGATLMVVGDRYSLAQNIEQNRLPAYCDLGLSADRKIDLRLGTLSLRLQVLNLLDTQYEVVRAYPMMGRNWKVNITYEF